MSGMSTPTRELNVTHVRGRGRGYGHLFWDHRNQPELAQANRDIWSPIRTWPKAKKGETRGGEPIGKGGVSMAVNQLPCFVFFLLLSSPP